MEKILVHGRNCEKAPHTSTGGYLHSADDDGQYDVDGLIYCGRCHQWMGSDLGAHIHHKVAIGTDINGKPTLWCLQCSGPERGVPRLEEVRVNPSTSLAEQIRFHAAKIDDPHSRDPEIMEQWAKEAERLASMAEQGRKGKDRE